MKRKWMTGIAAAAALFAIFWALHPAVPAQGAEQAEKAVYVCPDGGKPFFADEPGKCPRCGEDLEKQEYTIDVHMHILAKLTNALKSGIKKEQWDDLKSQSEMAAKIASRIPEFKPEKNQEKLAEYGKLAAELSQQAAALSGEAAKKDAPAIEKTYKAFGNTCTTCHQTFKN